MIAVVTGSTGFIGSHLVDALLANGATVRALHRAESKGREHDPRVASFEADLLDDHSVRESRVWRGATHVFHLAGATKARTSAQFRAANVVPTANILAALAAQTGTPPRTVLVSSQAAAGPATELDAPVRESDTPSPIEAYGRSKLQAEQAVARFANQLPITIVRPAAVYGPRDRDLLKAFRQATHTLAFHAAPRDQAFSIVHVADVVRALLLAGDVPAANGRAYFIANEQPTTWRDLYAAVATIAGTHPIQLQVPLSALRVGARVADVLGVLTGRTGLLNRNKVALARPRWWLCDASRARRELGWNPRIDLHEGLRETYLWYVAEGWLRSKDTATAPAQEHTE